MSDQITHIYHNAPGVLARINQVLAAHPVNILGQYLKTNERIGYVITDVDEQYKPAPDFTLPTPEGKPIALSSLRGQYVLIDFWASWCGPCRQENPNVVKTYATYKSRNFTVLGVSLDEAKARDKWLKAIADDQMAWPQVSGLDGWKGEAAARYRIQAIPQNFLIDLSGKIVAVNLRGSELPATLAQLLK